MANQGMAVGLGSGLRESKLRCYDRSAKPRQSDRPGIASGTTALSAPLAQVDQQPPVSKGVG